MRSRIKDIRTIGRNTQGVKVMKPVEGAKVAGAARAVAEEAEDEVSPEGDDG